MIGLWCCFFFQAEDGIRDLVRSRGLGDVYKRQLQYMYLEVSGDDKLAIRAGNRARNLNFNSKIQELSFLGQIQILNIFSEKAKRISPYLQFGAVSYTHLTLPTSDLV